MVTTTKIKSMALESTYGQTEEHMLETGKMVNKWTQESIFCPMVLPGEVFGRMAQGDLGST